ncbi:unnamed protein product [Rotaria sordida]|uniref:Uncharacterized protein n=1 Tax=Rotaria sordida TaxID=392033 RepID=A0A814A5H1_9BILA|nr:unnamed protein product [Rotaria sordida]CAF0992936.1 unnamed protein product [Rotaria sordida]
MPSLFRVISTQAMVSTVIRCFVFILFSLTVRVKSQFCHGISQYNRCSPNSGCACFYIAGAIDIGICSDEFIDCSDLVPCEQPNNLCHEPNHRCVHHPRCRNLPICYPIPSFNKQLCPLTATMNNTTISTIPITSATTTTTATQQLGNHRVLKWVEGAKQGIVVAGGQGYGNGFGQSSYPKGIVVDQLGTVYVADYFNRIMRWPKGATQGSVIVGGNGKGEQSNRLTWPYGLSFDRQGNLYVADHANHRVQKFNIE